MKKVIIPISTFILCVFIVYNWTAGFSAFTVFSDTLHKAGSLPRTFPDIELISQDSVHFKIGDKKKFKLVNYVYLNCPLVCHKVNNRLEDIYHSVSDSIIPAQLELITISFDLKYDNIQKIKNYRARFTEDIHGWTFAIPSTEAHTSFEQYLLDVGIWAKPANQTGIINHSVYLFLLSPDNQVIAVFDPAREDNSEIINKTLGWIQKA
ncbi:MAG: SCO family protein [Chitinophagales bacterium]|nr:SCO family protein [Chitinophagales bacterium]